MTEYGRGQGSEPWHPEDPLYGDGGWGGQQAETGPQSPYGGQPQHYPEQPQQPQYGDWGTGEQAGYGQAQQQYQYDQQYAAQAHGHQQYPGQGDHQQQAQGYHQQQYDNGGWATDAHQQVSYPGDPADPYGQQSGAYGAGQPDYYGTPDAYPPPEPPGRRRAEPEPEPETDWDPGPDQGEHAFFAGGDDDDDGDEPRDRRSRDDKRGRGGKPKKRRNGMACLVVVLVFGGGIAGVGYFGYQFYQDRFGDAPDFAGDGNGQQVSVEIPKGADGYTIGRVLKAAGVVKSVDAFVSAQAGNPEGRTIQDGVYTLQKQMSADSAVELMLSPDSRDNLIIAEGKRNADIYRLIDKRLEVKEGTTAEVAKKDYKKLGLPAWAQNHPNVKDPLEGFLFPSSYGVSEGQKPEDVLKSMVQRATETYDKLGVEKKAESLGLEDPWQLVTVASLVQAEGTSHSDFRKMAEVVYNRMKPGNPQTNGMLEFDSTYNYIKNQSKIDLSLSELRNYDNPYNTYFHKGLPPGPIDNPGEDAVKGALNPTDDGWYYFISLDGKTSKFTKTNAEHQKLVDQFNASRNN
ncbi:endolytic transglycosylase MltG [Streptomyces lomondensis]|uniref:Endolytic murein transglycosylase n=1 Tax=Streptomyces lomondensis TaxID=68229 RepID=A0ABQ2XBF4_9ACTN|nr:endolytic transglycosylase MltG [Streptomyces lomondensis]MCF0081270.1 endolytic transglycosylase MltG [Streptomyces lomondensis]GGX08877.1 membrane protein [Streptomyces lomondensis]